MGKQILLFIVLLGLIGCGTLPVTVATSNATKPVLVGKVTKIKGEPQVAMGEQLADFHVEAVNSRKTRVQGDYAVSTHSTEGANKFDVELLSLASEKPEGTPVITGISVGGHKSEALFLTILFQGSLSDDITRAGIDGSLYKIQK